MSQEVFLQLFLQEYVFLILERTFRNVINKNQLKKFIENTPPLRRGSSRMFSDLGDKGIISYAEYLFLVTLLTSNFFI